MLRQTFEYAELKNKTIEIDGQSYAVIKGKHSMYVPEKSMKIVWSYNGKIESYSDWDKGRNAEAIRNHAFNQESRGFDEASLSSIVNEYRIFEALAAANMSPPVNGFFYIKNMISDSIYKARHCDPKGCYGFFMEDANKMPAHGKFTPEAFKRDFIDTDLIEASENALGDLRNKKSVCRGYLVTIRRSLWDMMRWTKSEGLTLSPRELEFCESKEKIVEKIKMMSQFPHKERKQNYQSYYLDGKYQEGTRQTLYRFDQLGIGKDLSGKTALDLGCNLGAVCCEAYLRGARQIAGVDYEKDYIDCARDLARANGFQINYLQMDLMKIRVCAEYLNAYYANPIDIVFALSLYKHIKEAMWRLLEAISWKVCYIESHNAPEGLETGHVKEMTEYLDRQKDWRTEYLGQTDDRSPRCVWKVTHLKYMVGEKKPTEIVDGLEALHVC